MVLELSAVSLHLSRKAISIALRWNVFAPNRSRILIVLVTNNSVTFIDLYLDPRLGYSHWRRVMPMSGVSSDRRCEPGAVVCRSLLHVIVIPRQSLHPKVLYRRCD